jgi:hypothetical protein
MAAIYVTFVDSWVAELACQLMARLRRREATAADIGKLLNCLSVMGMTPAAVAVSPFTIRSRRGRSASSPLEQARLTPPNPILQGISQGRGSLQWRRGTSEICWVLSGRGSLH